MRRIGSLGLCLILVGCPANEPGAVDQASPSTSWYRPSVTASWQIQLQGTINTGYAADIYDIDLFDTDDWVFAELKAAGRKIVCYFSAGTYEGWRSDARVFRAQDIGQPLVDFPDERWLDIRSDQVLGIMRQRIAMAAQRGCDGVDPDNVDGYTNASGFPLSASDQLLYNMALAKLAHDHGLAVGLKNDVEQVGELVGHFDFAVNEQCHEYSECDSLTAFIRAGKPVLNIEYAATYRSEAAFVELCADAQVRKFYTAVLSSKLDNTLRAGCTFPL